MSVSSFVKAKFLAPPAITFLLNDAGETKAMAPVMKQLARRQVQYAVLANNTAKKLLKENSTLVPLPGEVIGQILKGSPEATESLNKLQAAFKAPCVVTGMLSNFQQYWAGFLKDQGQTVVGFDENFNYDRVMNKADGFIGKLTHLITPNEDTALFFQKRFKTIPVKALGHPTLETYMQKIGNTNRMDIQRRLNLDVTKPTVLYVGGLGNGYGKAYEAFCKAVASMKNANILFLPHPKTNGEIEKRILLEHPEHQIQTLDPNIGIETALAVSDIVAFHDSTMSVQALFAGKQVLHIGNPIAQTETSKFEPAVARNLAKRYKSVVDIRQGLMAAIDHYKKQSAAVHQIRTNNLNKLLGIPTNSTERITDYLLSLVKAPKTEAL